MTVGEGRKGRTTSLTTEGRAFLANAAQGRRENARDASAVLSPGEQTLFTEMCRKATVSIDALPR
ncbi:hypothetical protein ACF1FX_30920 [Streptomyces sp. NPDC014646]|uniref:hypothetical protein n=1 Tax=unclassified Streptomyces TaxID=2593676 RepID=UPI0036FFE95D